MLDRGLLSQDKCDFLLDYGDEIGNKKCTEYGKDMLELKLVNLFISYFRENKM